METMKKSRNTRPTKHEIDVETNSTARSTIATNSLPKKNCKLQETAKAQLNTLEMGSVAKRPKLHLPHKTTRVVGLHPKRKSELKSDIKCNVKASRDIGNCSSSDKHTNVISSSQKGNKKNIPKQPPKKLERTSEIKTQGQQLCVPFEAIPGPSSKVETFKKPKDKIQNDYDFKFELKMIASDWSQFEQYRNKYQQLRVQQIIVRMQPKLNDIFQKHNIHDETQLTEIYTFLYLNILDKVIRNEFNCRKETKSLLLGVESIANEWKSTSAPQEDVHSKPKSAGGNEVIPGVISAKELLNFRMPTHSLQPPKLGEIFTKLRFRVEAIMKLEKITEAKQMDVVFRPEFCRPLTATSSSKVLDQVDTNSQESNALTVVVPKNHPKNEMMTLQQGEGMMTPQQIRVRFSNDDDVCQAVHKVNLELKPTVEKFFVKYSIFDNNMRKILKQYISLRLLQKIKRQVEHNELRSKRMEGLQPGKMYVSARPAFGIL